MYQPRRQLSQMHIMNNTRFNKGKGDLLQKLRPTGGEGQDGHPNAPATQIATLESNISSKSRYNYHATYAHI